MHAPTASLVVQPHVRTSTDAFSRAILAGFVASLTMLLLFLVAFNLARLISIAPAPSWPALQRDSIIRPAAYIADQADLAPGRTLLATEQLGVPVAWLTNLTHNRLIDAGLSDVYLAAGVYVAGGLLWAILYARVERRLPGRPWQRGALFAMLPALVSLVVVLPVLGGGLFGLALVAGPLPAIGNILLHFAYGAVLGIVYGPLGDLDASTLERPEAVDGERAGPSYEHVAALALLGGLVVGGLLGMVASFEVGGPGASFVGESSAGLILWGALLGGVIGLFVGSFVGLGRTAPRHVDV